MRLEAVDGGQGHRAPAGLGDTLASIFQAVPGSIPLLAALGLAITYGVMGVINMAHGELLMVGAYSPTPCRACSAPAPDARSTGGRWWRCRSPGRGAGGHGDGTYGHPLALRAVPWKPCSPPGAFRWC